MNLSPHFTLREFTFSQTAIRKGINNQPSPAVIDNLRDLCRNVLEPLREMIRKPIRITSGYRSETLNRAIGGSRTSQHRLGMAADIQVEGLETEKLFEFIRWSGIRYDQLIEEFGSWVHISFNEDRNRMETLVARRVNGRTEYTKLNDHA